MSKIYISYNHKDMEIAMGISQGLKELGHEIVIDVESVTLGQELQKTLAEGLQSAEVFVSLLSEHSITSSYVLTELGAAQAYSQVSHSVLIIPVIIDDIPVPSVIQNILYLRATDRNVENIVTRIQLATIKFLATKAAEEKQQSEEKSRIETNAAEYIDKAIQSLKEQEKRDRSAGNFWYYLGYTTLVVGAVFGIYGISQLANTPKLEWVMFAYSALKSLIVIGLLIACSKYSFTLGKASMSEALKNADRIHAIAFGEFYLRAFGAKADWAELKEVFQHWNIDKSSTLSTLDTQQFDPKFLEAFVEIAKTLTSKLEPKK